MERVKLLSIFPAEIWLETFDGLEPKDLFNISRASTVFWEFLKPQRTCYLLPQVLQVLDKNKCLDSSASQAILKCRGVCSRWKREVNKFLQNRPYHFKLKEASTPHGIAEDDNINDIAYPTYFRVCDFTLNKLETQILPALIDPSYQKQNPFPSRHVAIIEDEQDLVYRQHSEIYRQIIQQILDNVGHHVWYTSIGIHSHDSLEWFRLLTKYVQLMPNLKSVYILNPNFPDRRHSNGRLFLTDTDMPFPRLNHCRLLSTDNIPNYVLNNILKVNDHVENVEIFRDSLDGFLVTQIGSRKQLSFTAWHPLEFIGMPKRSSLNVLRLRLQVLPKSMDLETVFHKLECYGGTLKECTLETDVMHLSEQWTGEYNWERSKRPLKLPKLKKFGIKLGTHTCLDFLLELTSLESLSLHVANADRSACQNIEEGRVNFYSEYGNGKGFMDCNIWMLMPNLKEVDLTVGTHSTEHEGNYKREQFSQIGMMKHLFQVYREQR